MRLLRRPVSLMYALSLLALGVGLGMFAVPALGEWRDPAMMGTLTVGAVLVLLDGILRQVEAARAYRTRSGGPR